MNCPIKRLVLAGNRFIRSLERALCVYGSVRFVLLFVCRTWKSGPLYAS